MMAAFMSQMLSLVHQEANTSAINAMSQGIDIPFQGLILRLNGTFEGLHTQVSQGGAQANIRQVSIIMSLGIANANTGGNVTVSETQQGNRVNALQAGDAIAVLALDENGNVINSGDANAGNDEVVVICQRLNADDIDCLAPPTTTIPETTVPPTTTGPDTTVANTSGTPPTTTPSPTDPPANGSVPPSGFGNPNVPRGMLPATGTDASAMLAIGTVAILIGGVMLVLTRKKRYQT